MRQNLESLHSIKQSGFDGFASISALTKSSCAKVPDEHGVFLVLRRGTSHPEFLEQSTGGRFKGKNPTVPVSLLEDKWVESAIVLYIGKAGPSKRRTLKKRLDEYMQFGQGVPVGHKGGRYIWQLSDSGDLSVCWKTTPGVNPRPAEKELIRKFEGIYGKPPFANLRR